MRTGPLLTLALALLCGSARSAPPSPAPPPAVSPAMVTEGVPGPGPVTPRRLALSAPIPGEDLTITWAGARLLVSDGAGALVFVDPSTGVVQPATLPGIAPPKKGKSKKPPPPVPVVPTASAAGQGGTAAILAEGLIWVFDAATGAVRWKVPAAGATRVQWSVDGAAVEGGGNQRHVVWAGSSGTALEAPDTRAGLYAYGALQQRLLVAVGPRLEIYDTGGSSTLVEKAEARAVALSPDGRRAAAGGSGGLWLIDADTRAVTEVRGVSGARGLRFSPDGSKVAVAGAGLRVVDASTGALLADLWTERPPTGLAWTPDGQALWVDGAGLYQAEVRGGDLAVDLPGVAAITALASGGGLLAAGDVSGGLAVWGADGALTRVARGAGPTRRLALDAEGKQLAVRQSADQLLDLATGALSPCAPTLPVCLALDGAPEAVPLLQSRLGPDVPAVALPSGAVSAAAEAVRIWDGSGALVEQRWFGEGGTWGRWTAQGYTWGAMGPAFKRRDTGEAVQPPKANAQLMLDRPTLTLMEGGPPASVTLLLTNTGTGPAYALRLRASPDAALPLSVAHSQPRFGQGERLLLPLTVAVPAKTGEVKGEILVESLYTGSQSFPVTARIEPFPVRVEKSKRKGDRVKLSLTSQGQPLLKDARVWLAVEGASGTWTAVTSGATGKLHPYKGKEKPDNAIIFDVLDLSASGLTELEYRLPDKSTPRHMNLMVAVPGGTARALSLDAPAP